MSKKGGRYLREAPKRKKKDKTVIMALAGTIVILLVAVGVMLWFVQSRSAYQVIVHDGYTGTQEQWLASLVGEETDSNAGSAYELAVKNGYRGTEIEWIKVLVGIPVESVNASPYRIACENGFEGSLADWLTEIADEPETLGRSNVEGQKTEYELACEYGYFGTFIEWIVSLTQDHAFE